MWKGSSIIRESNPCGLPGVLIEFLQVGFEKPSEGNRCIVEGRISLPANGKTLKDDYCFGDSVILCGKPLNPDWGLEFTSGLRTATMQGRADTFEEAFAGVENSVMEALKPLVEAYYARREILKETGWKHPPLKKRRARSRGRPIHGGQNIGL